MRKLLCAFGTIVAFGLLTSAVRAVDMTWTFAVQLSAAVNASPARVTLTWTTDPFPVRSYSVARKAIGDRTWGEAITLPAAATTFVDENVELGRIYEYQVIRHAVAYTAYGYVAAGINAPLVDARGKVILVVDRSLADPLATQLQRLQADLAGDGWTVVRKDVERDASPPSVKALIRAEWEEDRERTRAVFLLGHIPVVRSGNLNVDGHGARPMPADVFYADMDGEWTDANGDGIYDQNTLPSDVELMIGRVDFADMPGKYSPVPYPRETELMQRYLDKDHAFRHAAARPKARALLGGLGDAGGQAYSASGFRNFAALVGAENISTVEGEIGSLSETRWISRLAASDYLWVYGSGAGSDFTIGNLGTHGQYSDVWGSDFLELKAKGTFYMLFGSWFADWAKPDNILRSALTAPEYGLAAAWSGRPHLFFHHMGVGELIGQGIRVSQNNNGLYQNQVQRQLRGIHIALLGDPTLRMHQLAPASEVTATADGGTVILTWKASGDTVLGYHVYRGLQAQGPFVRLTEAPVSELRFVDSQRTAGTAIYMVRAIALNSGPSGSFYHASQGVFVSVETPAGN